MKNSNGFTLIELVVTIALVGILVGSVIPTFFSTVNQTQSSVDEEWWMEWKAKMKKIEEMEKELDVESTEDDTPPWEENISKEEYAWVESELAEIDRLIKNGDILWFMTDPRFYQWLWQIENEIRQNVPMVYYHVWDNYPYPKFNKVYYDSNLLVYWALVKDLFLLF